jgi:hypothetical protein
MCGENQPDEDSRLDRGDANRPPQKAKALDHSEPPRPRAETRRAKSRSYSFSALPSYFTVPFLSFWRETSSLV